MQRRGPEQRRTAQHTNIMDPRVPKQQELFVRKEGGACAGAQAQAHQHACMSGMVTVGRIFREK